MVAKGDRGSVVIAFQYPLFGAAFSGFLHRGKDTLAGNACPIRGLGNHTVNGGKGPN